MLQIWLERCNRFGITEVLINLHSHASSVRKFLENNQTGVRVEISEEPVLLGSAGTLHANRSWIATESQFWVFYADVLTNLDLAQMQSFHDRLMPAATIGVYRVPDPSRCGIVQLDARGMVTQFVEKPTRPIGNLAFSGILLAGQEFIKAASGRSDIGFDVLPGLVGKMAAYPISDYLIDIGTLENYKSAQKDWPACETSESVINA